MAVHQARKEIPWCTVFLVVGALVAHTLVLAGNLATAEAMNTLGHSTGGWSDVGVDLSGSLHRELDMIMANVTGVLSSAISHILDVQNAMDTALGLMGAVADTSLDSFLKSLANQTNQSSNMSVLQVEVHPSADRADALKKLHLKELKAPKPAGHAKRPTSRVVTPEGGALLEEEVVFMGEMGQPVLNSMDPIPTLLTPKDRFGKKTTLKQLPKWDMETVEALSAQVTRGAIYVWRTARDHAEAVVHAGNEPANISTYPNPQEFKSALQMALGELVDHFTSICFNFLGDLFEMIKPALQQVGRWLITFGSKVTDKIENFMTSVDGVQKIIDQIMSKLNTEAAQGKAQMIHEAYNLFDATHAGYISEEDLQEVGHIYGINALTGSAATRLFQKYDADHDGKMMRDEFFLFVDDESVPEILATVLRYYAKRLSITAGNVAAARYRDEVAKAVVDYLCLICAKNHTKVTWVSNTLTNRSLPPSFSADVLVELAKNADNPDQLTTADIGSIVVTEMVKQEAVYVGELLALMMDPVYWTTEGFEPKDQATMIQRVTSWISNTPEASEAFAARDSAHIVNGTLLVQLLQTKAAPAAKLSFDQRQAMPRAMHGIVVTRQKLYQRSKLVAMRMAAMRRPVTPMVKALRTTLGVMSLSSTDPATEAAANSGVPARPETLRFAQYLSSNATATANMLVNLSFDYTSESSSTLDSFSVQIKNMVKKVQNFISLMETYSTPEGIDRLEQQIRDFSHNAAADILHVMEGQIDKAIDQFMESNSFQDAKSLVDQVLRTYLGNTSLAQESLLMQTDEVVLQRLGDDPDELIDRFNLGATWSSLRYSLSMIGAALPNVVEDLKFARKEVSSVSSTLDSIFATFKDKGPPIFQTVSSLFRTIWVAYFCVFAFLTSSILLYGFWASGFLGGPQAAASVEGEEWYENPQSFRDRCAICCRCCDGCLRGCHDSHLCFWSMIILFQVIVLILFVVSIVLCLLAGIKAFIVAGCSEIYLLGDMDICAGSLGTVRQFLESFLAQDAGGEISVQCESKQLLVCDLIGAKMQNSAIMTVIGSLVAAVLSFQLVVESAVLHERARWRRIFDEAAQKDREQNEKVQAEQLAKQMR